MRIEWKGSGVDEEGSTRNGAHAVRVDPRYFRPTEVETLLAIRARLNKVRLGAEVTFDQLVAEMVAADWMLQTRRHDRQGRLQDLQPPRVGL